MKEISQVSKLQSYASPAELSESDSLLLERARQAISTSYAPYSKFHVGCALRLSNGIIVTGSNQENIAFPSGLCAERVTIFSAGANYPNEAVEAMAITVKAEHFEVAQPIMSCGACLQSMSEYEMKFNKPIHFILQGETGEVYVAEGTKTFMPFQFWTEGLRKG